MATVPTTKLVLRKKNAKDTEGYIKIAVYLPGLANPLLKSTRYKVPEKFWSADFENVSKKYHEHETVNREIEREIDKLRQAFKKDLEAGIPFTELHCANRLKGIDDSDFLVYYKAYIDNLKATNKKAEATRKIWDVEYKHFKRFAGEKVLFSSINTDLLNKYHKSLVDEKYEPTTIFKKLKKLRQIINMAIDDGKMTRAQIASFEMIKYQQPETHYLTLDQTASIWKQLKGGKFDNDIQFKKVAAYFLVACYAGLRFSDWKSFQVEKLIHNKSLKVRAKKNGEPVYLPLNVFKRLNQVINYILKNDLRFDLGEGDTNVYLKGLEKLIGVSWGLSTHDGRRTCGTLLAEMGYSDNEIAEVLGCSARTAAVYAKRTRQGLKNTFEKKGGL